MKLLENILITKVEAQSGDGIAQPTFVTDIDFSDPGSNPPPDNPPPDNPPPDNPPPDSGGDGQGSITVSTDATSFLVGTQFDMEVEVDSDGADLSAYTVRIEYNPDLLQVNDLNQDVDGTQIEFLDTVFNEVENTVNPSTGTIVLRGENPTATSISDTVGRITFSTLAEGNAEVEVITEESSLVDDTSANILETTNGLQINVGDTIGEPGEIIEDPLTPQGVISEIEKLPDSSLPYAGIIYMIIGTILIAIGLKARSWANNSDQTR